mmetsp:Transcript_46836/g.73029  ORF Transcript_46836/g.73029 Transcript_46836/m.73029 type:complete len:491 (+) Transcript_46836:51-1523(+)
MVRETSAFTGQSEEARQTALSSGRDLKARLPCFPDHRGCKDFVWVILFNLMLITVIYGCVSQTHEYRTSLQLSDSEPMNVMVRRLKTSIEHTAEAILWSVIASMVGGICVSAAYIFVLKMWTEAVVRTTMWLTPVLYLGIAALFVYLQVTQAKRYYDSIFVEYQFAIVGGCFFAAALVTCCLMRRWEKYVPFTVSVIVAVLEVVTAHPGLLFVAMIGVFLASVWNCVCLYFIYITAYYSTDQFTVLKFVGAVFSMYWGSMVCMNVTSVAYAGVFGRWYFSIPGAMTIPSLFVGLTTSLGSVCFGSFCVAFVRTLEYLAKSVRRSNNIIVCIVATILTCILRCIGDIIEYFNSWAYVQCAVRNASFCQAASITYSMATAANMRLIISELLLGWVAGVGTLIASIFGAAIGYNVGIFLSHDMTQKETQEVAFTGLACGFLSALIVGSAVNDIMSTGTKTILMLWAEDKRPFQISHPALSSAFDQKLCGVATY